MENKDESKMMDKSTKYILVFFIMLVVVFGILFGTRFIKREPVTGGVVIEDSYEYNGYTFKKQAGLWYTEVQRRGTNEVYRVALHYGPRDLEEIEIIGDVEPFLMLNKIYITFDPLEEDQSWTAMAAAELSLNIAKALSITPVGACDKNSSSACVGRPIINCSTKDHAIYLQQVNESLVFVKDNCIFILGEDEDLIKGAEKLLYKWYGIVD